MIKIVREVSKQELKDFLYDLDLTDKNLYEELNEDRSINTFQLSAQTAEGLVKKIKPKNFDEVCAVSAFARPGTINFVDDYLNSRDNGINKYPQQVQEVLKDTAGCAIYQEQCMSIFNIIGGFTLSETNEVRALMKILGKADKKKIDLDRWDEVVKKFENGAVSKGIKKSDAKVVADDLLKLSSYSFNLSHCVAYTYISMINLYLSFYFKVYYFSSILTYKGKEDAPLKEKLTLCKLQGFSILPPDINKSKIHFHPEGNNIRFGLNEVKSIGDVPATKIVDNQPYISFFDFMHKIKGERITKTVINALVSVGAFDELIGSERTKNIFILEQYLEKKKNIKIAEKLVDVWDKIEAEADRIPGLETTGLLLAQYEKEFLGFNFFHTLFTDKMVTVINQGFRKGLCGRYFEDITNFQTSLPVPVIVEKFRAFNDKNGREMAFVDCSDMRGNNISVPVFWNYWKNIKEKILPNTVYLFSLYRDTDKNSILFGTKKFSSDEEKKRMARKLG